MAVSGALIIRRKRVVLGAVWHGKAATACLYAMMLLHVFWNQIPPLLSAISIIVCFLMVGLSFILYAVRNIKFLRRGEEQGEKT